MKKELGACVNCGTPELQLHTYVGCDFEECPFCYGVMQSCDCMFEQLGLLDEKNGEEYNYLPKEIFENGLSDEQYDKWEEIVTKKGRLPLEYPHAPEKWTGNGTSPADALIQIIQNAILQGGITTKANASSDMFFGTPIVFTGFGKIEVRLYPGFYGRNPKTGEPIKEPVPPNYLVMFHFLEDPPFPQKIEIKSEFSANVDTTNLLASVTECAREIEKFEKDRIIWPEFAYFQKGFTRIDGIKKKPIYRFFRYYDFVDRLRSELPVPENMRRIRGKPPKD